MKTLALLCFEFFKTGLFAVGGGMATLPFLYDMAARYFSVMSTTRSFSSICTTPHLVSFC